jgi:hypothetical protein
MNPKKVMERHQKAQQLLAEIEKINAMFKRHP